MESEHPQRKMAEWAIAALAGDYVAVALLIGLWFAARWLGFWHWADWDILFLAAVGYGLLAWFIGTRLGRGFRSPHEHHKLSH